MQEEKLKHWHKEDSPMVYYDVCRKAVQVSSNSDRGGDGSMADDYPSFFEVVSVCERLPLLKTKKPLGVCSRLPRPCVRSGQGCDVCAARGKGVLWYVVISTVCQLAYVGLQYMSLHLWLLEGVYINMLVLTCAGEYKQLFE